MTHSPEEVVDLALRLMFDERKEYSVSVEYELLHRAGRPPTPNPDRALIKVAVDGSSIEAWVHGSYWRRRWEQVALASLLPRVGTLAGMVRVHEQGGVG